MNKNYILVLVSGKDLSRFIYLLYKFNYKISDIYYIDENNIKLKILKNDYSNLKKEFFELDFKILSELGLNHFKNLIKKNKIILLAISFGIIILFFLTNIVVEVEVVHSKKEIRQLVEIELENNGVKRLSFKKNYSKLEEIKNNILRKYPDKLEWLSIEKEGMNYIIRVEERIIPIEEIKKEACNLVATKDGIVRKIIAYEGDIIKEINNFVEEGDIIVKGEITLNDEIKYNVCASGYVYAEVWYSAKVNVPLEYEVYEPTGNISKNIGFKTTTNDFSLFKSKYNDYEVVNTKIFSVFGIEMFLQTEKEYNIVKKKYSSEELEIVAFEQAISKLNLKLTDEEKIISQNVLKKSINDSKIEMEIFFAVNEKISKQEEYVPLKNEE